MAARIFQIDLAEPLPTLRVEGRYNALWLLVRFGPQPLGWVRCPFKRFGDTVSPDLLGGLIGDNLWIQVHDAARNRAFEPSEQEQQATAGGRSLPSMSVVICTR